MIEKATEYDKLFAAVTDLLRYVNEAPAVYIDRAGCLWLYAPDGDHLAVMEAQTGNEIDRTRLSSYIGACEFVAHPDGVHIGLSVAQGQDGTNSYRLHLDEGRIVVRELPCETLAGVAPSGGRYLDLPHLDTKLAVRRFVDDHIVASCMADEIPGVELHDQPGLDEDVKYTDGFVGWLGQGATGRTTAPAPISTTTGCSSASSPPVTTGTRPSCTWS